MQNPVQVLAAPHAAAEQPLELAHVLEVARVRALGERYGAAGQALARHSNGRLDMMGHNMMQESTGFGSKGDDGERD